MNQSSTTQKEAEEEVKHDDILHSIVDSLFRIYPKALDNPIQETEFLKALDKSVKDLTPSELNQFTRQIPFDLHLVQSKPQKDGKYLVAFEYEEPTVVEKYADTKRKTPRYSIKIYGFAALDKSTASQLESHVTYQLSGESEIIDAPNIGGWNDNEITLGIEVKNASVAKKWKP